LQQYSKGIALFSYFMELKQNTMLNPQSVYRPIMCTVFVNMCYLSDTIV